MTYKCKQYKHIVRIDGFIGVILDDFDFYFENLCIAGFKRISGLDFLSNAPDDD